MYLTQGYLRRVHFPFRRCVRFYKLLDETPIPLGAWILELLQWRLSYH